MGDSPLLGLWDKLHPQNAKPLLAVTTDDVEKQIFQSTTNTKRVSLDEFKGHRGVLQENERRMFHAIAQAKHGANRKHSPKGKCNDNFACTTIPTLKTCILERETEPS